MNIDKLIVKYQKEQSDAWAGGYYSDVPAGEVVEMLQALQAAQWQSPSVKPEHGQRVVVIDTTSSTMGIYEDETKTGTARVVDVWNRWLWWDDINAWMPAPTMPIAAEVE